MTLVTLPKLNQTGSNEWADVEDNDKALRDVINGQLQNENIKSDAAIAHSKLANITAGAVLLGNGSNVPTATAFSGDATVNSSGAVTVDKAKVGLSRYIPLLNAFSWIDPDQTAGTLLFTEGGSQQALDASPTVDEVIPLLRFVAADYAVSGLTTKLNIRSIVSCNAFAPAINFVVGMYGVTVAGGGDNIEHTVGALVSGSQSTHTTPSASGHDPQTSGDFTIPADGTYTLAVVTSGTIANNARPQVSVSLRVRNV